MIFFFSEGTKRQAKREELLKNVLFFLSVFKTPFPFVYCGKKNCAFFTPQLCRAALNLGLMGL